ncbi:MAG: RsmB/NOP family class I SAM-dependent RNA methyltransferase [Bacteroidia bacterium]
MRLHKNLVTAVVKALQDIFWEGRYADKTIEYIFKHNKKWGSRDRAFIANTVYEMVRWWRLIWFIKGEEPVNDETKLWNLFAIWYTLEGNELPEWNELGTVNTNLIKSRWEKAQKIRDVVHSFPKWLDKLAAQELGEKEWEKEASALNKHALLVLRCNTLKISINELKKYFESLNIKYEQLFDYPDAFILENRINIFRLEAFKNGWIEIQDASSQLVAPFLDVKPGMRVVDACAGAGGKTLHIGTLMKNKGKIIAMDTEEWKLKELRKRSSRNGIDIIETKLIDSQKTIKRLKESADRLLLDVPCSGLGVLRRNPDAKWKLSPEFIEEVKQKQQDIISNYSEMLKPGGKMVYATCSILPSENQEQVKAFLNKNSNFKLLEEKIILPSTSGFDGFYMALLEKNKNSN